MTVLSSANVGHLSEWYRNRTIIALSVSFPLAMLAVILRFTARKTSKSGIWYDDWLACAGLVYDSAIRGEPIPESTLLANVKAIYVAELSYYITQICLKLSILAFYWRLFKVPSIYVPIYLTTGFVVAWFIASILVTAFQCILVASLWTPALRSSAKCVELAPFFFGTSMPNILADLFLLVLPAPYVWGLKISMIQKIFVMGFLLLGGFVLVATAIRLPLVLAMDLRGFLANSSVENSVLWSAMECCIGVICVCLPALRPVVRLLPWASNLGKSSGSGHTSGRNTRFLGPEHGADKTKKQQHDDFELLERDRDCCWVEVGRPGKGLSIKTMEEESITVQTRIQVSSSDLKQPAEAV
ncbi:hypothetical protein DM02DRAFT_539750 [Periconia macrospinosa]|uniref:Rhodopsin domain-containing protein n=1 Tax=Periconia macrospinosa TaxID=97972 RepID=A0A2V1D859_9PLEO|nr:hypothetical protein DM02DRAFT_539750 [Periconia macrospinosa]